MLDPPFQVLSAELVPRLTPLTTGLRGWLSAFGGPLLNALPSEERDGAVQDLEDLLRPDMYDPIKKQWSAMYVRLRVKAVKPSAKGLSPVIPLSSTPSAPGPIGIDPALVDKFATVSPESSRAREAADRIQSDFINQTVRVTIPDGRIFEGTFLCVDDGMNIILSQTNELRVENGGAESSRFVGMVMIKGEDVVKVGVKVGNSQAVGREGRTGGSRPQQDYVAGWPTDPAAYA
jgi:small nuclear ribonucleoprotein (snRNP)-like protein